MQRAFFGMIAAERMACPSTSGGVPFDSRRESAFNVYAMRSDTVHVGPVGPRHQSGFPPGRDGAAVETRGQRGGC